jgi:hypothetical protein
MGARDQALETARDAAGDGGTPRHDDPDTRRPLGWQDFSRPRRVGSCNRGIFRSTASVERSSEFVDDPARPHGPVLDRLAVATEDYHQQYWEGEGQRNPYWLAIIQPKPQKLRKSFQARVKSASAPA